MYFVICNRVEGQQSLQWRFAKGDRYITQTSNPPTHLQRVQHPQVHLLGHKREG